MNVRQAIQPLDQPTVLSIAFSSARTRFITGLSSGIKCFRSDNCLTTYHHETQIPRGIVVAAIHDDRYFAYVADGRTSNSLANIVVFQDALLDKEAAKFDFHEPVLGVRLSSNSMVVVLKGRSIVFGYQELAQSPPASPSSAGDVDFDPAEPLKGPNLVKALYPTAPNYHALACLQNDLLVLPAQSLGQIQIIPLQGGSKRVIRAHNSAIRCLALSEDCSLLATSSEQGTLIRVFDVKSSDQVAEFRRGVDHAIIYSLAFSPPSNRWLACTSDKGTLHIFSLHRSDQQPAKDRQQQHRKSINQPHPPTITSSTKANRLSSAGGYTDSLSAFSGRSTPTTPHLPPATHQGSVQEYYGLRPPPTAASPSPSQAAASSALQALKSSPFAPRILKDVRSIASAPFYTGNDPIYWQGGTASSWTTAPDGTRKRVQNPVLSLPNDPSGRPPKGVVAFAPKGVREGDDDGEDSAVIWVVGGGSDARWESFEIARASDGGWVLVHRGFRKFLTRQFVD